MPLQATSGAASYDAFGGGVAAVPNYIEDVFSTWLYTGNGSTQTITNGIDLAGKGGLTWIKRRDAVRNHQLFDTVRGATKILYSDLTNAQDTDATSLTSFNSNGFSLGLDGGGNANGGTYASWAFREQSKFFDVVTFSTTTGSSVPITVNHNLGSVPGCIIVKQTNGAADWFVYHRSTGATNYFELNTTAQAQNGGTSKWAATPTATAFTLGGDFVQNATYVAYLFAHNAGGFGLTGTDNVISCGSYTGNGSYPNGPIIDVGFEPQFVMVKNASGTGGPWLMLDTMRGWTANLGNQPGLQANNSGAEALNGSGLELQTRGWQLRDTDPWINGNGNTYIYIAIRRGPMRTPTTGTSVFQPVFASSSGAYTATAGFPVDLNFYGNRTNTDKWFWFDRLRGTPFLQSNTTGAESASTGKFDSNTAFSLTATGNFSSFINYAFRRAPGFFDEVCYTGTGSARTVAHNLGVAPELMIVKSRSSGTLDWLVYSAPTGNANALLLNTTDASFGSSAWGSTTPTASVFSTGATSGTNNSGATFVAYLFASCPGVSKVGSYTGTGTTQVINCGFTAGARFVLIKATSTTGNWLVWDSARGIVAGNDPYLALNSTAAEVTTTDWVDTAASGFELSNNAGNLANSNGVSYIFWAVA